MYRKSVRVLAIIFSTISILLISCEKVGEMPESTQLAQVFGNDMVIQREKPLKIWGKDKPGSEITVQMGNQEKTTQSDEAGNWMVILKPFSTKDGPLQLTVKGTKTINFKDILVGEVWVCSGQSNMEMPMKGSWASVFDADAEVAAADYPNIRLFTVEKSANIIAVDTFQTTGWKKCTPENIPNFSAVAYYFGRKIYNETGIPVGLIHTSWGGTVAEAWTSSETLKKMPDFKAEVEAIEKLPLDRKEQDVIFNKEFVKYQKLIRIKDPGMTETDTVWNRPDINDNNWKVMVLPTVWEATEVGNFDGIIWFRRHVNIPEKYAGKPARLNIGPCDDLDITWFNGVIVGQGTTWDQPRKYEVPAHLVKAGNNVIVVRVQDNQGGGGIWGDKKDYSLVIGDDFNVPLDGPWKYAIGVDILAIPKAPQPSWSPNRPSVLYNAMIHPLLPITIRGAIWYQGESNSSRAYQYRSLFSNMIKDWRTKWEIGDFPFYFVQLASYMPVQDEPNESEWAELREAQAFALQLPNTGMAVTTDIGNTDDVHPRNKKDVGIRLALHALKNDYGKDIFADGPIFGDAEFSGRQVIIHFMNPEVGFEPKGKSLKGFAVAGKDKVFHWAKAKIVKNSVIVWNPKVQKPASVRYNWADNPLGRLTNSDGILAPPFRSDNWPGLTVDKK